jgi:hypothetical protein
MREELSGDADQIDLIFLQVWFALSAGFGLGLTTLVCDLMLIYIEIWIFPNTTSVHICKFYIGY